MGLIADIFAGGGGASIGLEAALGRPVDYAINHDELALDVHKKNHPATVHLVRDVFEVEPRRVAKGRKVDYLWASPDCTHFSGARGGKPRSNKIRALATVVNRWAEDVAPTVIFVENVREFMDWGPLDEDEQPVNERKGEYFRRWVRRFERAGYECDWRVLDCSEHGAWTSRKRFFFIARRDGLPIRWPEPTFGAAPLEPLRWAADCIDFGIPCPSIFLTRKQARILGVKRPLAHNTLRRIANGVRRYVIETNNPFIVRIGHYSNRTGDGHRFRGQPLDRPLGTVTSEANDKALVMPYLAKFRFDSDGQRLDEPMPTITAGGKRRPKRPATGNPLAIVTPFLSRQFGNSVGQSVDSPMPTVMPHGMGKSALVIPTIVTQQFNNRPRGVDEPLPTITGQDNKNTLVAAFVTKHFKGVTGHSLRRPIGTITGTDHHSLTEARLSGPGDRVRQVRAFLTAFYREGSTGQSVKRPMRTITAKARLGLVEVDGVGDFQIMDIGMRMLTPWELALAQFGEFAEGFSFDIGRKVTLADQVRLIGNSVPPHMVRAIVEINKVKEAA